MFGWRRCFHVTTSLQNLCVVIPQHVIGATYAQISAHAVGFIELLWNIEPHNLYGNLSPLKLVLIYRRRIPVFPHLHWLVIVFSESHRVRD